MTTKAAISGGLNFLQVVDSKGGAEGGTRTPTVLLPPAPQAGASANSATSANEGRYGLTSVAAPVPEQGSRAPGLPVPAWSRDSARAWPASTGARVAASRAGRVDSSRRPPIRLHRR